MPPVQLLRYGVGSRIPQSGGDEVGVSGRFVLVVDHGAAQPSGFHENSAR